MNRTMGKSEFYDFMLFKTIKVVISYSLLYDVIIEFLHYIP